MDMNEYDELREQTRLALVPLAEQRDDAQKVFDDASEYLRKLEDEAKAEREKIDAKVKAYRMGAHREAQARLRKCSEAHNRLLAMVDRKLIVAESQALSALTKAQNELRRESERFESYSVQLDRVKRNYGPEKAREQLQKLDRDRQRIEGLKVDVTEAKAAHASVKANLDAAVEEIMRGSPQAS